MSTKSPIMKTIGHPICYYFLETSNNIRVPMLLHLYLFLCNQVGHAQIFMEEAKDCCYYDGGDNQLPAHLLLHHDCWYLDVDNSLESISSLDQSSWVQGISVRSKRSLPNMGKVIKLSFKLPSSTMGATATAPISTQSCPPSLLQRGSLNVVICSMAITGSSDIMP